MWVPSQVEIDPAPVDLGCLPREGDHKGRPYEREAVAPEWHSLSDLLSNPLRLFL